MHGPVLSFLWAVNSEKKEMAVVTLTMMMLARFGRWSARAGMTWEIAWNLLYLQGIRYYYSGKPTTGSNAVKLYDGTRTQNVSRTYITCT